ncbi:tripartite tricarboxylate transporter permease [Haloferax larsenii]|uniref:Putative membrane protein n=1 Tax=Haloferax larsenii TaxID=302484 RepID=A0A1H7RSW8_HALLR|nr:tripartite tricarboxylate transporter permease [Haloferax larsenii]SEL63331.1 putative membrane protein [Haloferax larsenii]
MWDMLGSDGPVFAGVAVGILLGTCSGLVPGLHANAFALLVASVAARVPGPPTAVAAAVLAAATVHTFLDIVPSLALGVPDAGLAVGALPGHRLVLGGRGREALRLSAVGSGVALCLAVPIAIPFTAAATQVYPVIREHLWAVLLAVVVALVWTEASTRARVAAVVTIVAASALGLAVLDWPTSGPLPVGGLLSPLFAGLFGVPVLLDAKDGAGVPPQGDAALAISPTTLARSIFAGSGGGAFVGYLPGVSAGVAGTLALAALPSADQDTAARSYVVATSAATTATSVFALFALAGLGTPRTGALVALVAADLPSRLSIALPVTLVAGVCGALLVPTLGDRVLALVGRLDQRRLVAAVCVFLVALSWAFAGAVGVVVLVVAAAVGHLPPRLGCRRVHLMCVLVTPLALG